MFKHFDEKNKIHLLLQKNKNIILNDLIEWIKIPSISSDKTYTKYLKTAAEKTKTLLNNAGVKNVKIIETKGHPIVYGKYIIDEKRPTVLVYGHYDVQPATPLELWKSPPFEPEIRNNKIYGRGTADDKGQVIMHIKAFEIMTQLNMHTCNVKFVIEGEEEIGSENLVKFISDNKKELKCDVILISDTSMLSLETPSISVGLKGLCYMEVCVTGPNKDLHSGVYGGTVDNPANILCDIIAKLKDENNKITIPGFYDKVVELNQTERQELNKVPFSIDEFKNDLGIEQENGEKGYTTLERVGIRPTLDVNGIWSGHTAEGSKTVLPSKAQAKISMRLVPNQDENEIATLFEKYFRTLAPKTVKVDVTVEHGGPPYVTPLQGKAYKAASMAVEKTLHKKPIPTRDGGSIPIVAHFSNQLNADTVLMGFGLNSDAIHSPNEKFNLENLYAGIATIPLFYEYFFQLHK